MIISSSLLSPLFTQLLIIYLDTVLLIICARRPDYLQRTLSNVLKYHPRISVPIVISEDGMDHNVEQGIEVTDRLTHSLTLSFINLFTYLSNK